MSSKMISAAICMLMGVALVSSSGCAGLSFGPNIGALAVPIPVSPYWMKQKEDRFHTQELYDRTPVLPPIAPGGPTLAIDPPSDDEVMRALEEIDPVQGNMPFLYEVQRNNVQIVKEKMADFVDPPRIMPLVGPVQLHHSRWKCTVYYTRVLRPGWPLPQHNTDESSEVVYIDHSHLHMVGNVNTETPSPMSGPGGM